MNSRQLRYFQEVLNCRGFSAAARNLHVAQPALSGHVAALEDELGVRLFERTNKGVVPTSAGLRLGRHVQTILRQIDVAKHDVIGGGDPSGEVLVALPVTAAQLIAGRLMRRVEDGLPRVTLKIIEGLSFESGNVMSSGRGDLGLVPNAADIANLDAVALFRESLYLVGRWDGIRPRVGTIEFKDVANYPLAQGGHRVSLRRAVEDAALTHGVTLQTRYSAIGGLHSMISLVEEGLCYTICNWALIRPHWDKEHLAAWKIVSPEVSRTVSIVWPKDRPMTDAIAGVRRILVGLLEEMVEQGDWPGEPIGFDSQKLQ